MTSFSPASSRSHADCSCINALASPPQQFHVDVMQVAIPTSVFVFDLLRLSEAPELRRCLATVLGSSMVLGMGISKDVDLLCKSLAMPIPSTACLLDVECVYLSPATC